MKKSTLITSILLIGITISISGCYSCKSYNKATGAGEVEPEGANKFFWDKDCKVVQPVAEEPVAEPTGSLCGNPGANQSYPGNSCGIIKIDKKMPVEVQLNSDFEYKIVVSNLTSGDVSSVVVKEHLSDNFKFQSSVPEATPMGRSVTWDMGDFGPEETKEITITGSATTTQCLQNCTTVDYVIPTCAYVKVVEPMLMITKAAPEKVTICEEIPLEFTVTNNGTGTASNVVITDTLPDGLITLDGKDQVEITVGTLLPGKSQLYTVNAKAEETGTYENKAFAIADGLKAESAMTKTLVTQPVLQISKKGPVKQYLGRTIEYTIVVTNIGDDVADDVVVEDLIPAGVGGVLVSEGGVVFENKATWELGSLMPEDTKVLTVSYRPSSIGKFSNRASATADCAEAVAISASTKINGIPALLLEVIDVSDPIEVGSNETYNILVTNQGTANATNVTIEAMLEDTMEYVSTSGPTSGMLQGKTVVFSPLPNLVPKATASWNVVVKAVGEGDVRFSVKMNSKQLERDVEETESTNFYE